jgi:pimeloyl-ACP methyl ester carboxylesterase
VETVVLVHGLWMSGWVMAALRRWLTRHGFHVVLFSYPAVSADLSTNAAALDRFLARVPGERVHLVGHSLGGLVILTLLQRHPPARPGRVVLLGSPVAGCVAAAGLARWAWGRALLGRSLPQWSPGSACAALAEREVGMIAGNLGRGLGGLVTRFPGPHDGAVTVEETRVPGLADHLVLPVGHSGMLVSRAVAAGIARFLRRGRFVPAGEGG